MVVALLGAATFDKPQSDDDNFFIRSDGARLSFGVTVAYRRGVEPELLTYRFHLRFLGIVAQRSFALTLMTSRENR